MGEMNCDELVEQVTDYLEAALSAENLTRLDDHLQVCIGCQAYLGEIQVTLRLTSSLRTEPMSDALESSLLVLYREWTETICP
jgi:predicted anti-sigma-YlaC factor YlaD